MFPPPPPPPPSVASCRDYAAGDMAQGRLAAAGRQQRLGHNFYVRWDGTRAYYFTEVRVGGNGGLHFVQCCAGQHCAE